MFLNPREIKQLTGETDPAIQSKKLNEMGITHMLRPDGEVLVSRSHMEKRLDGHIPESNKTKGAHNWNFIS